MVRKGDQETETSRTSTCQNLTPKHTTIVETWPYSKELLGKGAGKSTGKGGKTQSSPMHGDSNERDHNRKRIEALSAALGKGGPPSHLSSDCWVPHGARKQQSWQSAPSGYQREPWNPFVHEIVVSNSFNALQCEDEVDSDNETKFLAMVLQACVIACIYSFPVLIKR